MDKVQDALTIIILCELDQVADGKPRVPNTYFRQLLKGVKKYSHIYIYTHTHVVPLLAVWGCFTEPYIILRLRPCRRPPCQQATVDWLTAEMGHVLYLKL